jgi:hypothetical protein
MLTTGVWEDCAQQVALSPATRRNNTVLFISRRMLGRWVDVRQRGKLF